MERRHKEFRFDEVRERLAKVPGVPESATVSLTVIAFGTLPMPAQRREAINQLLKALRQGRAWAQTWGAAPDVLRVMDARIARLEKSMKPKVPLRIDRDGRPNLHFLSFADHGETSKRSIELGAFIVLAMNVLQSKGLVLTYTEGEEIRAANEEKELPPTAPEVLSRVLDCLGWEGNRQGQRDPEEPDEASRTPESVLAMYRRFVREFEAGALSLTVYDGKHDARLPSPDDIEDFIAFTYPGAHGIPEEQWTYGPPPRLWLPISQAA